jgi:hypothetical protein
MGGPTPKAAVLKTALFDATYTKVHRTATSLRPKEGGQTTKATV